MPKGQPLAIQVPSITLSVNMEINYHVKLALKADAVVRVILAVKSRMNDGHLEAFALSTQRSYVQFRMPKCTWLDHTGPTGR